MDSLIKWELFVFLAQQRCGGKMFCMLIIGCRNMLLYLKISFRWDNKIKFANIKCIEYVCVTD